LHRDEPTNEPIIHIAGNFGLLFAVLLGLLTVAAFENTKSLADNISREASSLSTIYRSTDVYPEPLRRELKAELRDDAHYVIDKDWPVYQRGIAPEGGEHRLHAMVPADPIRAFVLPSSRRSAIRCWRRNIPSVTTEAELVEGRSTMFDAKSLLDAILSGQTAQQASGAVQSAGSTLADLAAQAEESLKGTQVGDVIAGAKNLAGQNPTAAVAVAGGIAALLLGTSTGRSVTAGAAKLGGLAGLGGIAYKAFSNWQQSKPLLEGVPGLEQLTAPAPTDSGFHADDHSDDTAQLVVRAMVATAAADGTVDPDQRAALLAQMQRAGFGSDERAFLDQAIAQPATIAEIAGAVAGKSEFATQIVAAATLVANPANPKEQEFLSSLGAALGMSEDLLSHIRAAVSSLRPN
jgi:uncharacterized membrane protein YebE (DUF533 family)